MLYIEMSHKNLHTMKRIFTLVLSIAFVTLCFAKNPGTTMHTYVGSTPVSYYLPSSYFTCDELYPVLYLLHGSGDDETGWNEKGRATIILDSLISTGLAKEMIVVMPYAYTTRKDGETYQDWMMTGQFETNFGDLIAFTEKNFRAYKGKAYRAIAGLSMGGYHAMHISHYYNTLFDYVGMFSAVIWEWKAGTQWDGKIFPDVTKSTPKVYKSIEKDLKMQFKDAPKLYYIAIGRTDFLFDQNVAFRAYLDKKGYTYTYHESEGGHSWKNWQDYLIEFLPKLF